MSVVSDTTFGREGKKVIGAGNQQETKNWDPQRLHAKLLNNRRRYSPNFVATQSRYEKKSYRIQKNEHKRN